MSLITFQGQGGLVAINPNQASTVAPYYTGDWCIVVMANGTERVIRGSLSDVIGSINRACAEGDRRARENEGLGMPGVAT